MTRIPNLRWYVAALLFMASVINYVDRQALSVIAPVLTKELGISPIQYANILQAFLISYTVMYLGSGFLVDRWGTRRSLAVFMLWWSVSNMLHAFANTAAQFAVFRSLLGLGEPGSFMASIRAISEWYPPREKAFVNGLVQAGAALGAIVAAPLVVWIAANFGWRYAFVFTGAAGLAWLVPWLWLYRLPEEHPRITAAELNLIGDGGPRANTQIVSIPKSRLLRLPQTWGLLLARFVSDPVWWFYLFWMPKYLVEQRGFTMAEMGMLVWLPYLSADLGAMAGGLASGYLIKRNWRELDARKAVMVVCAVVMPLSILIALTPSSTVAVALISLVTFAHMAWKANLNTITNDLYPTSVVGSVSGIIAFGSGLGGTLFTNLTGQIVHHGSYAWIFVIMGFMHPVAYLVFRLLVKGPIV
jgi:MFS transporter, ACS family, hexuronate transporter